MSDTLDRLEAIAKAATPGPWDVSDTGVRTSAFVRAPKFGHVCNMPVPYDDWHEAERNVGSSARKNAAHIATFSPPVVLALIAIARAAMAMSESEDSEEYSAAYSQLLTALTALDEEKQT